MRSPLFFFTSLLAVSFACELHAQQVSSGKTVQHAKPERRSVMQRPGATQHPGPNTGSNRGGAANDLCSGAVVHTLNAGDVLTITGDNTGATDSEGIGTATVWEAFFLPLCANITISYCGTAPAFNSIFAFITQECPYGSSNANSNAGFGEQTTCTDDNWTVCFPNRPAGTWYIPVYTANGSTGPYSIVLSAEACSPNVAVNDDCPNAIPLDVNVTCASMTADNSGATQSLQAISCNGFTGDANDDTWFSFVATVTDMTLFVTGTYDLDAVVEVFTGPCVSPLSMGCGDATVEGETEQLELTGFTIGAIYHARVYHYYPEDPCDPRFEICLVEGVGLNIGIAEDQAPGVAVVATINNGMLTLMNNGPATALETRLFDPAGRLVHATSMRLASGELNTIDLSDRLAPGFHLLLLDDGMTSRAMRVLVHPM